ncbi:hypothetical protein SELMODRAFT_428312 [Selaginella moellendorffii]|uniref:Uncharacterized protein n=1 Tax=Selaginella moellendorffii TaxID=88036 RepID=D8T2F1_SELML|nr:hypothetical protein SELMODRAFT_428312 [Selaginella moellendorffii]
MALYHSPPGSDEVVAIMLPPVKLLFNWTTAPSCQNSKRIYHMHEESLDYSSRKCANGNVGEHVGGQKVEEAIENFGINLKPLNLGVVRLHNLFHLRASKLPAALRMIAQPGLSVSCRIRHLQTSALNDQKHNAVFCGISQHKHIKHSTEQGIIQMILSELNCLKSEAIFHSQTSTELLSLKL